ncbi:hypothetical protein [Caloramator proteoclasticus]|uniref:Uncharacterized protein n=1 Tax=Caloramator proteoclasticus DSM 10124 TaxID=1121262 RepID=A0A1M4ZGU8_9CLOT|nr:hypothetical protein [Caloramator proteoclasticus]SHF16816.1 hypothetical protein SAMN02746091_01911 [Caloramator proteoclasticus DSM 10124]
MNRAMRRKMEKQVRSKLTDKQFQEYKNWSVNATIEEEVVRRCDNVWGKMTKALIEVMRENRISEERTQKMLEEMAKRLRKIVNEEKGDLQNEQV